MGDKNQIVQPSIFHLYILEKLKDRRVYHTDIIKKRHAYEVLRGKIPKIYFYLLLKEMEGLSLIKIKDCQNIRILK